MRPFRGQPGEEHSIQQETASQRPVRAQGAHQAMEKGRVRQPATARELGQRIKALPTLGQGFERGSDTRGDGWQCQSDAPGHRAPPIGGGCQGDTGRKTKRLTKSHECFRIGRAEAGRPRQQR